MYLKWGGNVKLQKKEKWICAHCLALATARVTRTIANKKSSVPKFGVCKDPA